MTEAVGAQLLHVPLAWPLDRQVRGRQKFSRQMLPMLGRLLRKDRFAVFSPHDFQPDRISELVAGRSAFEQTYARKIRPKTDHELPSAIIEAVEHEHMPQFTLRNIGRYEFSIDTDEPLPLRREKGLGGKLGPELDEVRAAHVPKPEMAQIWSVDFVKRTRASLRRLLVEDPWELRFGQEATSVYDGLTRNFVVEGTHPDDMPGADWGPRPIPVPVAWVAPPPGADAMDRPVVLDEEIRRMT